jgi:hypothetical protein
MAAVWSVVSPLIRRPLKLTEAQGKKIAPLLLKPPSGPLVLAMR